MSYNDRRWDAPPPAKDMNRLDWRGLLHARDAEFEEAKHPRDVGGKFGSGRSYFHGTVSERLESIKKHGLDIKRVEKREFEGQESETGGHFYDGARGEQIFITNDFQQAKFYADETSNKAGSDPIILRVELPDEVRARLSPDKYDPTAQGYTGSIKPEWIKGIFSLNSDKTDWNEHEESFAKDAAQNSVFMVVCGETEQAEDALSTSPNSAIPTAAGIMLVDPKQHVLFVKRSATGDHPGAWAFPGGGCHPGETTTECARRETKEETGYDLADDGALEELCRHSGDVDYTTYRAYCDNRFNPSLNDEHTAARWVPWGQWPSPLHPGVEQVLDGLDDLGEDAKFEESDHPRGQPGNAGEFGPGGAGGNNEEGNSQKIESFKAIKLPDGASRLSGKYQKTVYHFTNEQYVPSILEEGVRHSTGSMLGTGGKFFIESADKQPTAVVSKAIVAVPINVDRMIQLNNVFDFLKLHNLNALPGKNFADELSERGVQALRINDPMGDGKQPPWIIVLDSSVEGKATRHSPAQDTTLHRGPDGYLRQRAKMTEMLSLTTKELRDDGVPRVHAHPGPRYNGSEAADMALDRASVREKDADGRLHVEVSNISKAAINEYMGHEIPDWESLRLDPNRRYKLFRDPAEIAKAVGTFNNLPVLSKHVPVSAVNYQPDLVIGSTGTDAAFVAPFLRNSLVIWAKPAIDAIESGEQKELSSAYRYVAEMTSGNYEGQSFDGTMTQLIGNHVALVRAGRAGADVAIGDSLLSQDREWATLERALLQLEEVA